MKTILVFIASTSLAFAGDFINLGFEEPNLSHVVAGRGPTSEVLQGWTLNNENGIQYPPFTYVSLGTQYPMSLSPASVIPNSGVDFGKYNLFLAAPSQSYLPIYHLSQTGTIPSQATDLQFLLVNSGGAPFDMLINGKAVPYTGSASIEVANVSSYAGQTVNLEFTFQPYGGIQFDIAGFTTTPEPSTYALFGVGAVMLWWQSRRKSS